MKNAVQRVLRRMVYIFLLAMAMSFFAPSFVLGSSNARLIIDYREVTGLDVHPIILNNSVMVPARAVFEQVGGRVGWSGSSQQVTINFGDDVLIMTVGQRNALLNGRTVQMEVAPVIINGRTLIPLRFPSEAFGFGVAWDSIGRAAILRSPNYGANPYHDSHILEEPPPPPSHDDPSLAQDTTSTPIVPVPHPRTSIIGFLSPRDTGSLAYAIVASSPITDVKHFLLPDNRLVVDIYNAVTNVTGPFLASGPVSAIRSSQFSVNPHVTRFVFDLTGPVAYSLSLSHDRLRVTLAFTTNNINDIAINSNAHSDTISIHSDFKPSARLSSAGLPNYLTVYIDNAYMLAEDAVIIGGRFASQFVTGQLDDNIAYIRVYVRDAWPNISLNHHTDSVDIVLHQGLDGVRYDFQTRELRICRNSFTINIDHITHLHEYLLHRYTLTLPGGANLGIGTKYIANGYKDAIRFGRNASGQTTITFETTRVMTFTVHTTSSEYVIRANLPQDVAPFIVVIDPGHGGRDPGAVHHGIRESDVVLAIAHMVMEHLDRNPNIQAYMTRHTDISVANAWRAAFANQLGADLYVSIHANAVRNRPNVSGIETWYMSHTREANRGFTSRQAATIMQRNLIAATGAVNRGLKTTPNFVVLRDTHMPAVLLEVGFLSNAAEAARLNSTAHQRLIARAIYDGIVEAYNLHMQNR